MALLVFVISDVLETLEIIHATKEQLFFTEDSFRLLVSCKRAGHDLAVGVLGIFEYHWNKRSTVI